MSKKSLIDAIEIKNPCSEDWNAMTGNERVRFCSHCATKVNNLSAMTRKQALRLVRESGGKLCVRYVKNPVDNQPVFAERLYKITRRASVAAGVLSASLALSTFAYAQSSEPLSTQRDSLPEVSQPQKDAENDKIETATARVSGVVTDPSGAVVARVPISLFNQTTKETRTTQSDENGFYEFENVAADSYTLNSTGIAGFAPKQTEAFTIADAENVEQNLELEINLGYVTMGMMVVASAPRQGIHLAVANENVDEVRQLIARGASVNQKDENYSDITPLFVAVENGNAEIAAMLLSFGAKANARDDNRQTPLMRLDEDASAELVNLLIRHGARVRVVDKEGNTPLILAARAVKADVLRILINHSPSVDAQNAEGRTALMEAADADNTEAVRALLEAGASVNLKDKEGETAYDLATEEEIEKLLVEYGAIVEPDSN